MKPPNETEPRHEPPVAKKTGRPYEAPRILSREPLEAVAATCGKADTAFPSCNPVVGGSLTS